MPYDWPPELHAALHYPITHSVYPPPQAYADLVCAAVDACRAAFSAVVAASPECQDERQVARMTGRWEEACARARARFPRESEAEQISWRLYCSLVEAVERVRVEREEAARPRPLLEL